MRDISGPICGRETTKSGPEFATSCGHKLRKYGHRRPKYGQLRPFLQLAGRRIHQYFRQSWHLLTNGPRRVSVTDILTLIPSLATFCCKIKSHGSQCTPHSIMFSVCLCLVWTWAKLYKLQFSPGLSPAPPQFSRPSLVTDRGPWCWQRPGISNGQHRHRGINPSSGNKMNAERILCVFECLP